MYRFYCEYCGEETTNWLPEMYYTHQSIHIEKKDEKRYKVVNLKGSNSNNKKKSKIISLLFKDDKITVDSEFELMKIANDFDIIEPMKVAVIK